MDLNDLKCKAENLYPQIFSRLKDFIALPSVAAQHSAIPETVSFVQQIIEGIGGEVKVLDDLGGNPVVYGFFPAGEKGNPEKTLLFYNHYDVQPAEPMEEWDSPPFELTEREGILFARGIGDNKGDLIVRLTAIQVLQELDGGLPCNVKLMIEGEEEIGSPNLAPYMKKYGDLFKADACIWEFGYKDEAERVCLTAGLKGLLYLELYCKGADMDLHSNVAGYIENPLVRLVNALSTLKDERGTVLVDGYYDDVIPPTEKELQAVLRLPFDEVAIKEMYGLRHPLLTEVSGKDPRVVAAFEPIMTVCGIHSGYIGEGTKTVLPKDATAKLENRIVAGQDPEKIVLSIRRHLDEHGFSDIEIRPLTMKQRGFRSDFSDSFMELVIETAKDVYETEILITPNHPGCGPMYDLGSHLNLPIVSTGIGWAGSRYHAPNESVRVNDLKQGIVHIAWLLKRFGSHEIE